MHRWIQIVVAGFAIALVGQAQPDRWEAAIQDFEKKDQIDPPPLGEIVFVGSSTIRIWNLAKSFADLKCINCGFGGSQMADSARYAGRIVVPYRPRTIVVYAGDNDIAAGKTPEQVATDARALVAAVHAKLPRTKIIFISIKPSIARWKLFGKMREANRLIAEYTRHDSRLGFVDITETMLGDDGMPRPELFVKDGLHLSPEGYSVVSSRVRPMLDRPAADAAAPPNVIVIQADDLGYGDLGCFGHERFKTPHIDRMAADGARLTQFNTPMPFCAPTRASLLTGRYPFRCRMTANPAPDGGAAADAIGLPRDEITLAEELRSAGYATGMVGKWHLGHKPGFLPTRRGFDEYFGIPYSNDMRPVQVLDGETVAEYPVVQATLTRRYTTRALDFIDRNKSRPFFLYFAHAMPHKPLAASDAFYKKSGAGLYGDAMAELDWSVGQVLAKLKQLDLDEKTFVVFTSDNGPWYGGSTGGLRGMKGTSWEGGYRVPLVARWPGKIPPGHTSGEPAVMMDLFATVLKIAQVAPPAERVIDGKDILPLLTSDANSPHDAIFGHQGARLANVRDARWKLHVRAPNDRRDGKPGERWIDPRGPDGVTILAPYEQHEPTDYPGLRTGDAPQAMSLFDLEHDPGEQHNVAAEHPEVVERLKTLFDEMSRQAP